MRRVVFSVLLQTLLASIAGAQRPTVELRFDNRVLEQGEVAELLVVCTNTGTPEPPVVEVPDGLRVELTNTTPSTVSQTRIINGRRTDSTQYTFHLRLIALAGGTYTLGPATIKSAGQPLTSNTVPVVVQAIPIPTTPRGDQVVFVELQVSDRRVYVSEPVHATLTIGIREVRINGRSFDVNLLGLVDARASQLNPFPYRGWSSSSSTLTDSTGAAHRYELFRVSTAISTAEAGRRTVGPIFVRVNYPTAFRQGYFGVEVSQTQRESARTDAIELIVEGPPTEGRPREFSGAIGHYAMTVDAMPKQVEQGQPVTLVITIRGEPLAGVPGPKLTDNAELTGRFDFTTEELVGELEHGAKVFRRAVFPRQPGDQTLPPLRWAYFDPTTEQYVTLVSDPVALHVTPASSDSSLALRRSTLESREPEEMTLLTGGISPNYVDAEEVLTAVEAEWSRVASATVVGGPFVYLVCGVWRWRRSRIRSDPRRYRRRQSVRAADRRIREIESGADNHALVNGTSSMLAETLTQFISDRFGALGSSLTASDVHELLAGKEVDPAVLGEITRFLELQECARFDRAAKLDVPAVSVDHVRNWINQLDQVKDC